MKIFLPDAYYKSIYEIDYKKLKNKNIKLLMFDFDNTIIPKSKHKAEKKHKEFFKQLKKDFDVVILSNTSHKEKIETFTKECNVDYINLALKPLSRGFIKAKHKYKVKKDEMCMVGDQLITDVLGAKKLHIKAILVDSIDNDEIKATRFNRMIENKIIIKRLKKYDFERGKYYD